MRIAICQMKVVSSLHENLMAVMHSIGMAAAQGADVVLFPETALTGYLGFSLQSLDVLKPELIHEALAEIQSECRRLRVASVVGQYFKRCGRWYNNAVAIDSNGRIVGSYDKCQLVDKDCYEVAPGSQFPIFKLGDVNCSMAICHDIRYPEILRQYARQGSQVHFHLFYGVRHPRQLEHQAHYDAHIMTRAIENGFFFAGANAAENEQMVRSQVMSPEGALLSKAPSWDNQMLYADIDSSLAGDGWAQKRRADLFENTKDQPQGSYFERNVWENKPYMIKHDRNLIAS